MAARTAMVPRALWSRVDGVDGAGQRAGSPKRYSADAVEGKRPGAVAARWLASNDNSGARRIERVDATR